jgi:hypothetical protein
MGVISGDRQEAGSNQIRHLLEPNRWQGREGGRETQEVEIRGRDLFPEGEYIYGYDHLDAFRHSLIHDRHDVEPPPDPREVQRLWAILQRGETAPGVERLMEPFNSMNLETGLHFPDKPWEIDAVGSRPRRPQQQQQEDRVVSRRAAGRGRQTRKMTFENHIKRFNKGPERGGQYYKVQCGQYRLGPVAGGLHFDSPGWSMCMRDEGAAIDCVLFHKAFSSVLEVLLGGDNGGTESARQYDEHYLSSVDKCTTAQLQKYRNYRVSILEDFTSIQALYSVRGWEGVEGEVPTTPCPVTGITHASQRDLARIQALDEKVKEWLRTVTSARHQSPWFGRTYSPPLGTPSSFPFHDYVRQWIHDEWSRDVVMETDCEGLVRSKAYHVVHVVRSNHDMGVACLLSLVSCLGFVCCLIPLLVLHQRRMLECCSYEC